MSCKHQHLQLDPSPFAELAGFERPNATALRAAESSGRPPKTGLDRSTDTFPGPLVLPHDDLNYDPDCPRQDFNSWVSLKERNKLSIPKRHSLYVVEAPTITKEVDFMKSWSIPENHTSQSTLELDVNYFVDYLTVFYHGMDVKTLHTPFSWTSWQKSSQRQPSRRVKLPQYVGLTHDDGCIRIRVRTPPDRKFPAQLNLHDITDALIEALPSDAYAIVLLVDQDMYEDDEDDFCCGRAFGGSRVAVVQTARYQPCLDADGGIDRAHMWPMSHCKDFVDELCALEEIKAKSATRQQIALSKSGPMRAAIDAASKHQTSLDPTEYVKSLWFSRLARTVSHELGHCFGMGHCVFYACNMQGTAGMQEDLRQPPYLCAVCEVKIAHGIAGEMKSMSKKEQQDWSRQRREALMAFCLALEERHMTSAMWKGLYEWLKESPD